MQSKRPTGRILLSTVAATALLGATPASAVVDEIIVTAQKREQSLQDVPIAVSAYDSKLLMSSGVHDVRELVGLSPSLVLTSSQSEAAGAVARIRGIGTTGDNAGLESAVGIFIDGVYRNRTNVGLTELGDVERIEVLRGPQGTLFGKNTSAGLINIVTKKASLTEASGYGEVAYGFDYDEIRATAGITAPLVQDILGAKIEAVYHERDGFIEDVNTDRSFNDRDRYLVRGQLQYEPTADFSLRLIADYADRSEQCCASVTAVYGATVPVVDALAASHGDDGIVQRSGIFVRQTAVTPGRDYQQDVEEWGVSGEINWDLANLGTLTSITAYRDWSAKRTQDIDFSGADIAYRPEGGLDSAFETFTQELRLAGQWERLNWLVGVYYENESLDTTESTLYGVDADAYVNALILAATGGTMDLMSLTGLGLGSNFPANMSGGIGSVFNQEAESWSVFTHDTFTVTEKVDLTFGLRYTDQTKELEGLSNAVNPACSSLIATAAALMSIPAAIFGSTATALICPGFANPALNGTYADERSEDEFSGTVNLTVKWTPDFMTYASYGRGYKAGGFNLDRAGINSPTVPPEPLTPGNGNAIPEASDLQFEPEFVDAYEIGAKSRLFGNQLVLNTAVFYEDFEDFQLNTFNGINFIVTNLAEVTSTGFEVEAIWRPTEGLSFLGGLTYADTKYGDDLGPNGRAQEDRQLTNAPLWVATGAVSYTFPLWNTGLMGLFHLDGRWSTGYNTGSDLDEEKEQDQFAVFNGRIGVSAYDGMLSVELFGRNLFEEDYHQVVADAPLQGSGTGPGSTQTFMSFLGEPRVLGISVRAQF